MRIAFFAFFLSVIGCTAVAQRLELDLFGGISNYQGDLQPRFFTAQNANPGAAAILKVGITEKLYLRAGFSFGSVAASDATNKASLRSRNLSFRSGIQEFAAGVEYRLGSAEARVSPYLFGGVGVFRFNPYAYDPIDASRVYLQPLRTEGQGLPQYPSLQPYQLTQVCFPFGFGVKWNINCNLNLGFEFRQTATRTDYLDDVSGRYADPLALLAGPGGQRAVDFAWRGDELNGAPYPPAGSRRGNPEQNDWYYFAGLTVGLRIHDCETGRLSLGGLLGGSGRKGRVGCPTRF